MIEADFDGGDLSSDGGLMLVRQIDQRIGLSRAAAAAIGDARDCKKKHSRRGPLGSVGIGGCGDSLPLLATFSPTRVDRPADCPHLRQHAVGKAGDEVKVKVLEVKVQRKPISLTMMLGEPACATAAAMPS